eukprot:GHVQ01007125.1.p2 GENE.GHVQ01007125.1~~GHVQ01007125.1.p2  ORF type:complete len:104 (+),score=33.29 GHVQ01007125.1:130-441(+)
MDMHTRTHTHTHTHTHIHTHTHTDTRCTLIIKQTVSIAHKTPRYFPPPPSLFNQLNANNSNHSSSSSCNDSTRPIVSSTSLTPTQLIHIYAMPVSPYNLHTTT